MNSFEVAHLQVWEEDSSCEEDAETISISGWWGGPREKAEQAAEVYIEQFEDSFLEYQEHECFTICVRDANGKLHRFAGSYELTRSYSVSTWREPKEFR